MPELPEVETVKNVLIPIVKNRTIKKIDVYRKSIIHDDVNRFINGLENETFLDITRIGKFLVFHLTNDKVLISHLRMEGKYYEFLQNEPDSKYARVVFHLDNNHKLCYDDSRTFGMMMLSDEKTYRNEKEIAKLGPEPFAIDDVSFLLKRSKNKKLPIKSNLLNQSLMTGLGNIYVDETLYASKIHPLTPSELISQKDWENIVNNAKEILTTAISLGGSTIKSYHPGKDIDGNFQTRIKIYGKANETCPNCGATFRFIKVGGRGTTFCPRCQIKVGAPLNVAITGKIASGKSLLLNECKKAGFAILSSDQIVNDLYKKPHISKRIEELLKIKFPKDTVDKNVLRNHLLINPKDKKKLEKYVHLLVLKEIKNFLSTSKSPIRIVEVPLLFEAKMDVLFDTIIVCDVSIEKQLQLLNQRDPQNATYLLEINKTNKIDENKNKATYLIENDGDKNSYIKKCKEIINKLKDRLD